MEIFSFIGPFPWKGANKIFLAFKKELWYKALRVLGLLEKRAKARFFIEIPFNPGRRV